MEQEITLEEYTLTFTVLSILSSIFLILLINKNSTSYGKLVNHIVMGEAISLFCIFLFILIIEKKFYVHNFSRQLFQILTFNFFSSDDISKSDEDEFQKFTLLNKFMIKFNISAYYSSEVFSLFLNVFICLEIILVLKNPLAQIKNRVKSYFIITYFLSLIVFILNFIFIEFKMEDIYDSNILKIEILYRNIFYSKIGV